MAKTAKTTEPEPPVMEAQPVGATAPMTGPPSPTLTADPNPTSSPGAVTLKAESLPSYARLEIELAYPWETVRRGGDVGEGGGMLVLTETIATDPDNPPPFDVPMKLLDVTGDEENQLAEATLRVI